MNDELFETNERKEVLVKGMKINITQLSRDQGVCWATAKKIATGNTKRKEREFKGTYILEPYIEIIDYKLENYQCTAASLYHFIKDKGYTGSQSTVSKYVSDKKKELLKVATIRVETSPGLQGQVDWKESLILTSKSGESYKVNIFLFILSYSKMKYIELTIDRTQTTLFNCMINCFKYLGGIPEEIWFDNMKTVVESHDINTNKVTFNQKFQQFSKDMMFTPIACKPYRPCTKGVVENLAKVMDRLKVYNEEFDTYEELDAIVKKLNEQLNTQERSQATGQLPITLFEKEKEYLTKVNMDQFNYLDNRQIRKVTKESLISYDNCKYSVPVNYLFESVKIDIKDNQLQIYYNDELIRTHEISAEPNKTIYNKDDLRQILKSAFPKSSEEKIEAMAHQRLQGLDVLLNRKERSYE